MGHGVAWGGGEQHLEAKLSYDFCDRSVGATSKNLKLALSGAANLAKNLSLDSGPVRS